jgi:hypothetical protein
MARVEKPVAVVVSIADDHLDDLAEVVVRLRGAGLVVDGVMDAIGMISGTVDIDAVEALEAVDGVTDVELQRSVRVSPPDVEIQ